MGSHPFFPADGLSDFQAAELLNRHGLNELPRTKPVTVWVRFLKLLKEPMLFLLLASGTIYLLMGDLGEGLLLGGSIFLVMALSFYQEQKSDQALAALRELSSPRALVIRNGVETRVSANLLVPGDLIVLHEGDRVPADGAILQSSSLSLDE
ncbi:MAG: cation-transporting P-type ATPase, partial [Bdellovibrionota bacterium]